MKDSKLTKILKNISAILTKFEEDPIADEKNQFACNQKISKWLTSFKLLNIQVSNLKLPI